MKLFEINQFDYGFYWLHFLVLEFFTFFLNFGFQAPIFLTPALGPTMDFKSSLRSHLQFCTEHFQSLCHMETGLLDLNLLVPSPQPCVLLGFLFHFGPLNCLYGFLTWPCFFRFLLLHFTSH